MGGQRWQPSCCPTEILYLRAKSYLGHTFNSCKLQLAPLPWISSWRLQRSWDFCLTFLHPWKGRKRAQPIRAVIASAISPEPVCEWVFRKLNAMAGNHKLPPKKKKKSYLLILLVSLLGKAIFTIVSVNFLGDHPTQSNRWRAVSVWMANWVPILKTLNNVRNYFWVYTWIIFPWITFFFFQKVCCRCAWKKGKGGEKHKAILNNMRKE